MATIRPAYAEAGETGAAASGTQLTRGDRRSSARSPGRPGPPGHLLRPAAARSAGTPSSAGSTPRSRAATRRGARAGSRGSYARGTPRSPATRTGGSPGGGTGDAPAVPAQHLARRAAAERATAAEQLEEDDARGRTRRPPGVGAVTGDDLGRDVLGGGLGRPGRAPSPTRRATPKSASRTGPPSAGTRRLPGLTSPCDDAVARAGRRARRRPGRRRSPRRAGGTGPSRRSAAAQVVARRPGP